ncbi:carbohydrate-binding module family 50 protein [Myriangium duriaei CBS 260.36]|uniref:Carbohydrate-binding module family 50 protein n=1 Tax=Myriangium duriaei CBS 260.36 TaxID=1168546 RepID=A0A9P4MJI1_9PEZI|nr:carbohydrate-binding module family 50 protein [Myriangium duriaei CBS 260.36]
MSTSRTSVAPSSSLRPRAARLISGLSDTGEEQASSPSKPSTRTLSRPQSPPRERPSRSNSVLRGSSSPKNNAASLASLWGTSWNAIQGIANDFLGEQELENTIGHRRNSRSASARLYVKPRAGSWGPKEPPTSIPASYIATGSREEREALVRDQKRKALLSGASNQPDASGKYKRRTSDDGFSVSAPPGNEDRDALVYLHHVKPEDTLAGITIRYSCQANTLRRANRMWPNDTVQVRKVLTLPVDACGVKGRPISEHEADLICDPDKDETDLPTPRPNGTNSHHRIGSTSSNFSTHAASSTATSTTDSDPPWTHDSWVMFPNATMPTEIARLPRRTLGYFPPARRKSQSFSDLDTPNTSLELSRTAYFDSLSSSAGSAQSPLRDPPQRPRGTRKLSGASNGYFPSYLAGPGGVGTMAKNVHSPGPAQDGLNRLFASKLPNVAPPVNQQNLYMPDVPLYQDYPSGTSSPYPHGTGSGLLTPTGQGLNLENVGAAVEGWIKKIATKAQKGLDGGHDVRNSSRTRAPGGIGGPSGIGDLIEMADNFEIGSDDDTLRDDAERGRSNQASGAERSGASFSTSMARSRGKSAKAD